MKCENIIFDLGGVIERIAPEKVIESFKAISMQRAESFFSLFRQSDICSKFETGEISITDFINYIRTNCTEPVDNASVIKAWCSNQLGVEKSTLSVLKELKKRGYHLFILSNTNAIHYGAILKSFNKHFDEDFEKFFDGIYLSYVISERKPSVNSYQKLVDDGIPPLKSVYIDDLEVNLQVPKGMGFSTIFHETNKSISYLLDEFP
jgi:glucose-1-phosphatase